MNVQETRAPGLEQHAVRRRLRRFMPSAWPLSAQISLALALALLPLGALAVVAAIGNYDDLRASQADLARSRIESLRRSTASRSPSSRRPCCSCSR